jgi:hypothetical protein
MVVMTGVHQDVDSTDWDELERLVRVKPRNQREFFPVLAKTVQRASMHQGLEKYISPESNLAHVSPDGAFDHSFKLWGRDVPEHLLGSHLVLHGFDLQPLTQEFHKHLEERIKSEQQRP